MGATASQRIDKWLFFARALKSRSLAQKLVASGAVRINGEKVDHASATVKPGDGVTIRLERRVLVWRVLDPGTRRGPAEEARKLYEDLTPPDPPRDTAPLPQGRDPGTGRPTKRERRAIDRLQADGDP
ncbi:MAG: RNA-binding S4 domain-containing protein [Mesorhizobium sp.]